MIAGFSGDLVSHAYVEQELLPARQAMPDDVPAFARRLARWWREVSRALGPASTARSVHDLAMLPLLQLLGHDGPAVTPHPIGLCGTTTGAPVTIVTLPWSLPARTAWREALRLGLAARAPWALIGNGHSLRIVDCTRAWTRAGVQFDFADLLASPKGTAALWWLAHAGAITGTGAESLRARVAASDAHGWRVCGSLGNGVLEALPRLATALAPGRSQQRAATLDQALTVIYRILFLLFAEARGAVPVWHEIYREAYSIGALIEKANRPRGTGLWSALRAMSRLAHAGCRAGDLDVTAFNGRLFSPAHAPLVEQRRVPDAVVRDVLLSLATEPTAQGRRPISYHDLGVEQLGSVYERVLEYEPRARGPAIALARTSTERKATGSFYTPRSITEFLVRRTLAPLVDGRTADRILALRVLDPAMGSGAFLVAACRYLADQCEHALIDEGRWTAAEVTGADRATLRRQVAERCLYGVDLNPTAVQLARLSMWLTTLAADRPLTCLDHHLAVGNSLVGARLGDLSQPVRRTRRAPAALPLLDGQLADTVALRVLPARWQLAVTPSDSLEAVKDKERTLAALTTPGGPIAQWSLAADLWCAARLWPGPPPSDGVIAEWIAGATGAATTMPAAQLQRSMRDARAIAGRHGAFHWELAFPEVFFDERGRVRADGGFDAVLGNPPWDMVRADIGSTADRDAARAETKAALRFYRAAFSLQGQGHANRYQLFLERAVRLTTPGGRVGLILPSGIATDHGSGALRRHLFDCTTIDTWAGFDNTRRIFPIHRSMRFVVMTAATAGRTGVLRFRCGLTDPDALDRDDGVLSISRSRLEAWSDELSIPEVTNAASLALLSGVSQRIPPLADASSWHVRFGRELNATDDRPHFVPLTPPRDHVLPIVEGKLLSPFRIALDKATTGIPEAAAARLLDRASFERPRIAYRDVASATNKLTLIAAVLPARTISTHTVFVAKEAMDEEAMWCLLGLMNSLVANYLVRLQVTTHVTTALMSRLPMPRPATGSRPFKRLAHLARQLSVRGIEADEAGYAELNAIAARLYGVSLDQYRHIVETFPLLDQQLRSACVTAFNQHGNTEARKHRNP